MSLRSEKIIKEINYGLANLTTNIRLDSHINLTDKAQISESIFGKIFSIIFKARFDRSDIISSNYPAIDLISNDIVIQVSTDATIKKIRKTIETFKKEEFDQRFSKLKFLFITSKNPTKVDEKTFINDLPLNIFNPKEDIYYSEKLSSEIQGLDDSDLEAIRDILWKELGLDYKRQPFKWIKELEEELSRTSKEGTTNTEFENDLIFYTPQEKKQIDSLVKKIDLENKNTFLITGYPSTGKTTVAFDIGKKVQDDRTKGYYPFYVKIKAGENLKFADFHNDIERIGINPAILIIDDIHLNFQLANELLDRSEHYPNIIFLFVSRFISKDLREDLYAETGDIFEELRDARLSFEKFNTDEFYKEKITGIIEKHKTFIQKAGHKAKTGNPLKIFSLTQKNLFKLRLILNYWVESKSTLSEIDNSRLNKKLYSRFFARLTPEEQTKLMEYACLYSLEIPFSKSEEDNTSEKEGLFFTREYYESLFMHSSFSDLLIDAYLFQNKILFERQYNSEKDRFIFQNIKNYVSLHTSYEFYDFPDNIYYIFYNVGINRKGWLFNQLLHDKTCFKSLVKYFQNSKKATSEELKNIFQITKIKSRNNFEKLVSNLMLENKNLVNVLKRGSKGLITLSYVHYSIHPNNKQLKTNLYKQISDESFKDLMLNRDISKLTLALKYLQDKQICNRLINLITRDQWVNIFENVPFKFLGNSLTELKTINAELAFYIYQNMEVNSLSKNIGRIDFDSFTKTLSEVNTLGNQKAKFILSKIPQEKIQKSISSAKISQIGIGISRLKRIDEKLSKNIAKNLDSDLLYNKIVKEDLNNFGRVLVEIYNVNKRLASEILYLIKKRNSLEERFNSAKIKGKEISHLLESLFKIGDKEYGKYLLETANKDILWGRILSSNVLHSSHIIKSINYYDQKRAYYFLQEYLKTNVIEKLEDKKILLNHLPNIFDDFATIDSDITKSFFSSLNNYFFVKKSLSREVDLHAMANSFNNLKKYDSKKINDIIVNLNSHKVFHKKISECSVEKFFSSLSIFNKLCPSVTESIISSFKSNNESKKQSSIQFSQFCDGLYRLSKVDRELAMKLLNEFKPILLKSFKNVGFRKLTSGLNTLGKLDLQLAKNLLNEISVDDLKSRLEDILNNQQNVKGALGEIRNVDNNVWKILNTHAAKKSNTFAKK